MKTFLSILLGIVAGIILVTIIESIGHQFYPPPEDLDWTNTEVLREYIAGSPIPALLFVIAAHFSGMLGSVLVARLFNKDNMIGAYVSAAVFMLFTAMNLSVIPSPIWFVFSDIGAVLVAFLAGYFIPMKASITFSALES